MEQDASTTRLEGDVKAIEHFKEAVLGDKHWYIALLEAIKLWKSPEEEYKGCHYRYLINGEAFDWLLLAERLCEEVTHLIPEKETIALLFFDQPPLKLATEEFKNLIGNTKYRAYLNYIYGILVEEALVLAVVEEIRKEQRASGLHGEYQGTYDEAYRRIYNASQETLLKQFLKEKHYPQRRSITLTGLKEFTYWLFKYRLENCDKARVASDTKKALAHLQHALAHKAAGLPR